MDWWSGKPILAHPEGCLRQLAAHTLNTDWGLRDVSGEEKIYDGMSYHQGSVWPLFTGWAALAEYRGGQPLAGYQMLMENANLTRAQDLGAVTELLSGDYFVPFGRSTSHQLWSSAMVITPTLRGLFGIDIDAQKEDHHGESAFTGGMGSRRGYESPYLRGLGLAWLREKVRSLGGQLVPGSRGRLAYAQRSSGSSHWTYKCRIDQGASISSAPKAPHSGSRA